MIKVVAKDTVIPVALVVCTDIIFLCTPGELPTDPLILLHQPSQRTGCKVESDADSKRFVLTMEGGERHLLECTTDKEALFWINSIQKMEGWLYFSTSFPTLLHIKDAMLVTFLYLHTKDGRWVIFF